jgi:hypothetical protein
MTKENIGTLAKALPKLMGDMKNATNTKGGYGYNYAPLNEILDDVRPILTKHGFSLVQTVGSEGGMVSVTTTLIHDSGESIGSTFLLPPANVAGTNEVQKLGASITYARRYMLTSILGIAGEEDTDGRAEGNSRPVAPPPRVEDLGENLKKAHKMVKAIIVGATTSEENRESMTKTLEAVVAMEDSEDKLKQYRKLYSSIQKTLKGEQSE